MTALLISALLCSCGETGGGDSADTGTSAVSTTTEAPKPAALVISGDVSAELAVVRGDMSSSAETAAAVKLRKAVSDLIGTDARITTDWEKNEVFRYELIVGNTLREETEKVEIDRLDLGKKGYTIKVSGEKIFIAGGSDEGTTLAVDYFIENVLGQAKDSGKLALALDYAYTAYQQYDIPNLYINGKQTKEYPIVCEQSDVKAAEALRQSLYDKTGVWHEIVTDGSHKGGAFVLSKDKPKTQGIISVKTDGESLVFATSSQSTGISGCVTAFVKQYISGTKGSCNFPADFEYVDLGDYIIVNY